MTERDNLGRSIPPVARETARGVSTVASQSTVAGESWGSTAHHPNMEETIPFERVKDLPTAPQLTYPTD